MARPPRIDFPNAFYHVTSRGNARGVIFWSDDDRQRFLAQLADSLHTSGVQLYAFVLMGNASGRSNRPPLECGGLPLLSNTASSEQTNSKSVLKSEGKPSHSKGRE